MLLLLSSPARATTMVRMSDEALTLGADAIVTGTVTDVARRPRPHGGTISTYVTLAVDDGDQRATSRAPPSPSASPAARVGDDELHLYGTPQYDVGESVIAFLAPGRRRLPAHAARWRSASSR